ncbi:MAG: YbfB/YjiJ family MFS transporter [Dehalococcoidia bacterium]|nr:YbfB/YjiJ family MFS transporter [Dehalococcoidia bacterium]
MNNPGRDTGSLVPVPRLRLHYGYVALAMASLALLTTLGFGRFAYSLILPGMKEGLSLNYTQMGLLGTVNTIGYLAAVPLAGVAASRFGSRMVIAAGMLVTGLALAATGAVFDFGWALFSQTIAGVASAGAIVPSMAFAGAWVARRKRGIASGFITSGVGISFFATGPVIPSLVASYPEMGWRYAWFLVAGVVFLSGLLVAALLRSRPQDMGLQVMGFNPEAVQGDPPGEGDPPGRPYGSDTRQAPASALNWGLIYRSGAVWHLSILYGIFGFAYISYLTFFAAFLREQGGLAEGIIGNMWAISGLGMIAGSLVWGSLSDRLGRRLGISAVFVFLAIAIFLFTTSHSVVIYTISAVLFWAAEPGVPVIVAAACGDYVGGRLAPAAVGFATLFMGIGQAIGPYLTGGIADMTGSFNTAFYVSALVALLGMASALFLRPTTVHP